MRRYLNLWQTARRAPNGVNFLSRLQRFLILWVLTRGNVSSIAVKQKGEPNMELFVDYDDEEAREACNDLMREHLEHTFKRYDL